MTRKQGLTIEQHRDLGGALYAQNERVALMLAMLSRAYPVQGRICRLADRLQGTLRELRSELEEALFQEHPTDAQISIYYPAHQGTHKQDERIS